ncbi:MAG: ATP-dependent zinc metalloprotease FtsH [Mycoplasmatales bacterium]|nr:ATP-dependent zinc metalloprotease FtsH [Mycoplasmatales bacterium]
MAQAGQTNKPKPFNWVRLIIVLLIIATASVLAWWIFHGFGGSDNKEYISLAELKVKLVDPQNKVRSVVTDIDQHRIMSEIISGGKTHHYVVDVNAATLSKELQLPENNSNVTGLWLGREILGETNLIKWDSDPKLKHKFIKDAGLYMPEGRSIWISLLLSLLPVLLFGGIMAYFVLRGARGIGGGDGIMSTGRSPAKKIISKKRFSDVAGQEEAKEEVKEVVDFMKRPGKYKTAGARIPKGIMLGGPPGTGKTLLAKAIAGESGVPFYFISASNFVEMFAGMGAKRVREMFKEVRKNSPAILFIDEMDAVGRKRGSSLSGNDEREQTLNQILVEMDGIVETNSILVISATNRPDVLDPALTRPGRFDRTITVNLPDIKEREQILLLHAKGKRIDSRVDFKNVAKRTPRYSGADLENVINEATLLSVREDTDVVTLPQIDEAIDRVMAGPAKKHRVITAEENKLVAIHEAGHAVVGLKVKDADIVQKITIIPRGDAGGYTLSTPRKEQYNYRKSQLEAKIMGLLGGRAAEQVYFGEGEVTTGASDDIQKATNIARAMVTQYGMSVLGPIAYEKPEGSQYLGMDRKTKEYSDALAQRIDEAIRVLVKSAEEKAITIIKNNKQLLDLIVEELIEKETIVIEEIDFINKHLKRPPKNLTKKSKVKKKSLDEIIEEVKKEKTVKKSKSKTTEKKKQTKPKTKTDKK